MKEIEAKILEINRTEVEKKLVSLGGKKVFEGIIDAHSYDYPDRTIMKSKSSFRIRKENQRVVITFKKFISNKGVKKRNEFEVEVSDFEIAKKIIEALGLKEWKHIRKKRTSYRLEGTRFEMDKYIGKLSFVPEFLEIEAKDAKTIYKQAAVLGFQKSDCKPWTTSQVIDYYSKK